MSILQTSFIHPFHFEPNEYVVDINLQSSPFLPLFQNRHVPQLNILRRRTKSF